MKYNVSQKTTHAYVTYFDKQYAARGLSMMQSLFDHDAKAHIIVLALDPLVQQIILDTFSEKVCILTVEELFEFEPLLHTCKNRSPWELYATQKPILIQYAMQYGFFQQITYVDADLLFFSDLAPFFIEVEKASIAISPHRFPPANVHLEMYGIFNAGFIYFKNDNIAKKCLADWCSQCLAWCYNKIEADGRFMNQGYLNEWPNLYANLKVITHSGINLAPWNLDGCPLAYENGEVFVNNEPLICYHYSGLVQNSQEEWYSWYPAINNNFALVKETIYRPYFSVVDNFSKELINRYQIKGTGNVRDLSFDHDLILMSTSDIL